ncbi:hypothetical protein [Maridesulfovibrio bastinii]|uniref:hypothetical protein n=1 Tax=Maridesulfovibrio bastinii TaxID=47157 RepID=UPI0003FE91C1|nr:hypothetical protein [Maridesulfovibrio bastinii]
MANVLWKTLVPYVQPEVTTCPKGTIINEIRRSAIVFCESSSVWEESLDQLFFPAGLDTAGLDAPHGARVFLVTELKGKDGILDPRHDYYATASTVTLREKPSIDASYEVRALLKPTLSSDGMPEGLIEDWGLKIAYGAIASLKAMRGLEWEDLTGAQIKMKLFNDGIADARLSRLHGGTNKPLRVRSRSFF